MALASQPQGARIAPVTVVTLSFALAGVTLPGQVLHFLAQRHRDHRLEQFDASLRIERVDRLSFGSLSLRTFLPVCTSCGTLFICGLLPFLLRFRVRTLTLPEVGGYFNFQLTLGRPLSFR